MNNQNQNFLDTERWQGRAFFADWQTTAAGVMDVTDPATGAVIASVGVGGAADIARAATEARAAQKIWAKTLPTERARILFKAADLLEQNGTELIPWIMRESGSIIRRPASRSSMAHSSSAMQHRWPQHRWG
nr:aldehyde dehydrogenase family protein [Rhizobium leguminosarum]